MSNSPKTPCINCICKPICRHKNFTKLVDDCSLIDGYLFITKLHKENFPLPEKEYWRRIRETTEELKSTKWIEGHKDVLVPAVDRRYDELYDELKKGTIKNANQKK